MSHSNLEINTFSAPHLPHATITVVYTQWNKLIIDKLVEGVKEVLTPFPSIQLKFIEVPGCFEIPYTIKQHYLTTPADVYIALGCVIKGDTPHFDYVCQAVTQGCTLLNTTINAPVIFGVLTVLTELQAQDRIGGVHGHKGKEAALTALKMLMIKQQF